MIASWGSAAVWAMLIMIGGGAAGILTTLWPQIARRFTSYVDDCLPPAVLHVQGSADVVLADEAKPGDYSRLRGTKQGWGAAAAGATATGLLVWRIAPDDSASLVLLGLWLVVAQAGILLSLVDIATRRLPTVIIGITAVLIGLGVAVAATLAQQPNLLTFSICAGVCVGGSYLLIALAAPHAMGLGDVRLVAMFGAALGPFGWSAVFLGATLPYLLALPFALGTRCSSTAEGRLPFGPFLAAGAVISVALTAR